MDKIILGKFLKSGFVENGRLYQTLEGAAQGGVISPALTIMTLSGLEKKILPANQHQKEREKINVVAYADDFIVTADNKEILENRIKPILVEALKIVGLELSPTKTKITHIDDGFDFLGFNVRKYKEGKLLIKPAKENVKRFLQEVKATIEKGVAMPTENLIHTLNSRLTGWVNYYRSSVASKVFAYVDHEIFHALMRWALKRHARKSKRWIVRKYFTTLGGDNWRFHCHIEDKDGKSKLLYLKKASDTKIRRHLKIHSAATPFNPEYKDYFKQREETRKLRKTIGNLESSTGLRVIQPY